MKKQPTQRPKQESRPAKASAPEAAVKESAAPETAAVPAGMSFDNWPDHPTARPWREASVLQMQRELGNSRVQRLLRQKERPSGYKPAPATPRLRSGPRVARHNAPLNINALNVANATATATDPNSFVTTVGAAGGDVIIDAVLDPPHGAGDLADHRVRWRGGEAGADALHRRVPVGSAGRRTVTLTVDGNSRSVNIHVVNATPAPAANPAARLVHTLAGRSNPGRDFGLTVVTIGDQGVRGPKLEIVAHLNGNQWQFRVVEISHNYKVGVSSQGRRDVTGPGGANVRSDTIAQINADLTPPAAGAGAGPPRARFWSQTITRAHEEAHVTHFYNDPAFWRAEMANFEAEIEALTVNFDPADATTRSTDAVLRAQRTHFQTRADHFHGVADAAEIATAEIFAHDVSNPMYTALLASLRGTVAPPAPRNVAAVATAPTSVTVTWVQDNVDETGFVIERRQGRGPFTPIANVGVPPAPFVDGTVQANTSYTYRVAAVGPAGSSKVSPAARVTTPP